MIVLLIAWFLLSVPIALLVGIYLSSISKEAELHDYLGATITEQTTDAVADDLKVA